MTPPGPRTSNPLRIISRTAISPFETANVINDGGYGRSYELSRFVGSLRLLRSTPMTDKHLRKIWGLYPSIGNGIKGQILSQYVTAEESSLFGFFNAGTNVFWHRDKMTAADFNNNDIFSTEMLRYAHDHLN